MKKKSHGIQDEEDGTTNGISANLFHICIDVALHLAAQATALFLLSFSFTFHSRLMLWELATFCTHTQKNYHIILILTDVLPSFALPQTCQVRQCNRRDVVQYNKYYALGINLCLNIHRIHI